MVWSTYRLENQTSHLIDSQCEDGNKHVEKMKCLSKRPGKRSSNLDGNFSRIFGRLSSKAHEVHGELSGKKR